MAKPAAHSRIRENLYGADACSMLEGAAQNGQSGEALADDSCEYRRFMAVDEDGDVVPNASAGENGTYNRNFSRDGIIAALIAGDAAMLGAQLHKSCKHQARAEDPTTGAMPWRVHHENPGVMMPGRETSTAYSAGDTTALLLTGAEGLMVLDRERGAKFRDAHMVNLKGALWNLQSQIGDDGIFREFVPRGAAQHGTKVTTWKDSELHGPNGKEEPNYTQGVAYGQLHFIAARGILSASRLLNRRDLARTADHMFREGIKTFMERKDGFLVYRDCDDELVMPSSDAWFSLAFIPTEYGPLLPMHQIESQTAQLETPYGHVCAPIALSKDWPDPYHGPKAWVMENGIIREAALRFRMMRRSRVASLIAPYIGRGLELLDVSLEGARYAARHEGNDEQLWSVTTKQAMAGKVALPMHAWM